MACNRLTKQGEGEKCSREWPIQQVDLKVAQHLLSPFSSPFFGVAYLYDYGV
jgi:hypothetical protein